MFDEKTHYKMYKSGKIGYLAQLQRQPVYWD